MVSPRVGPRRELARLSDKGFRLTLLMSSLPRRWVDDCTVFSTDKDTPGGWAPPIADVVGLSTLLPGIPP
eukprot:205772-Amphidinium_carterae.1